MWYYYYMKNSNQYLTEQDLMHQIMLEVSADGNTIFRVNVGGGRLANGQYFTSGVPKGHSDLYGIEKGTGKAFFIETKQHPKKPTAEQCKFLLRMIEQGAKAGVAYTTQDAKNILKWKTGYKLQMQEFLREVLNDY